MNWKLTATYALCLFLLQFVLGFAEGVFTPTSSDPSADLGFFLGGLAVSLLASATLFLVLSARHPPDRWMRAVVVLLIYTVSSLALDRVVSFWLDSVPTVLAVIDWLGVAVGALVGTSVGALLAARIAVAASQASRQDA